jgi:ribose transport system substrate-binding protein
MPNKKIDDASSATLSRRSALLLAPALLYAAGCKKEAEASPKPGTAEVPGQLRFAFVTNNSSKFWSIAEKGLRKAEKDFGIKAEIFRPLKGDVADQQRFLEDILVQNFDGVAISPINPDGMTGILDKVAARIPVVCHDSDAAKSKRKSYVGTNNVEAGRAAGDAALQALKAAGIDKGKVGLFVGRIDMQNAIERRQGVEEKLKTVSGLEILPVFLDNTDRAKAKKNIEDALARYPDLVLSVGLWSYNGPCLAGAIRESARAQKPIIIAFDEEEETLKAIEEGLISATIVQKPFEFGYQSMKLLKESKEGKPVPPAVDTGIVSVDKANLPSFWQELRELTK